MSNSIEILNKLHEIELRLSKIETEVTNHDKETKLLGDQVKWMWGKLGFIAAVIPAVSTIGTYFVIQNLIN